MVPSGEPDQFSWQDQLTDATPLGKKLTVPLPGSQGPLGRDAVTVADSPRSSLPPPGAARTLPPLIDQMTGPPTAVTVKLHES